ncbi:hypothetical protein [Amaricoccus tamworthensis]|uniref:hypothetical protein n=1 Tax=Amaricoccus tamworthensis TaxID=57002 RepID=UPI003C7CA4DB
MSKSKPHDLSQSDRLVRSLELYRDVSVALRRRIEELKEEDPRSDIDCKQAAAAIAAHQKALQTLLDLEARLAKQNSTPVRGDGLELDLETARAEIFSRIDVWRAKG